MTDIKEVTLKGISGNIAALEMGNPNGKRLFAVHGWLDNGASFIPLARELPHYHWISMDFAGHGKSDHRPAGTYYHIMDHVADMLAAVNSLEWSTFDLIGHSLGAGVASLFAAAFPERIGKLVLVDGIGPVSESPSETLSRFRRSMAERDQKTSIQSRPFISWGQLVDLRMAAGKMKQESAEILMRRNASETPEGVVLDTDRRLKQTSPAYMENGQVCRLLGGIEAQTLLIRATNGIIRNRESTASRLKAIKRLSVKELEGNHHLHMDEPKSVAPAVAEFLQ